MKEMRPKAVKVGRAHGFSKIQKSTQTYQVLHL